MPEEEKMSYILLDDNGDVANQAESLEEIQNFIQNRLSLGEYITEQVEEFEVFKAERLSIDVGFDVEIGERRRE